MPATNDGQGSFLNRMSIRRNQVAAMENHDQELEDLELFQKHVAERLSHIHSTLSAAASTIESSSASTDSPSAELESCNPPLLSISWFRNLLDTFLCCEAEVKAVLVMGCDPSHFTKTPLDKLIPDLLDRSVKALDICNAITHKVELVRHWQKLAQIAVTALQQNSIGQVLSCQEVEAWASQLARPGPRDTDPRVGYHITRKQLGGK